MAWHFLLSTRRIEEFCVIDKWGFLDFLFHSVFRWLSQTQSHYFNPQTRIKTHTYTHTHTIGAHRLSVLPMPTPAMVLAIVRLRVRHSSISAISSFRS